MKNRLSLSKPRAGLRQALIATAVSMLCIGSAQAAISSTFDTGTDGWAMRDISGSGSGVPTWSAGAIESADINGWNSFAAPAKFLGNLSGAYGGTLSFDMYDQYRDSNANDYFTVLIASGNTVLYWYGGAPSTTSFTSFSARLDETDTRWRMNGSGASPTTGTAVTKAVFQSVLGNVSRLQFDADWNTGSDVARLDNVVIAAVPEPETFALLMAGLGLVGAVARRKSSKG